MGYLELDISAPGHRPESLPASPCNHFQFQPVSRGNGMVDFSIRMKNKLRFSTCDAPHVPTSKTHEEIILVELRGDLLMITALGADGSPGSRVYAQRTIDLPETSLFMILPELPSHVRDGAFPSARHRRNLAAAPDNSASCARLARTTTAANVTVGFLTQSRMRQAQIDRTGAGPAGNRGGCADRSPGSGSFRREDTGQPASGMVPASLPQAFA